MVARSQILPKNGSRTVLMIFIMGGDVGIYALAMKIESSVKLLR
jgi:hypothetical protein